MASDSEAAPFARAVLITVAVLALYVLSLGPVWRWRDTATYGSDGPPWVTTTYYPIWWTIEHCEPARKALLWYLNLWHPPHNPDYDYPRYN
jgi:hypothetical protein